MRKRISKKADLIICRCEEVTKDKIEDAIDSGARSISEIRRLTRAGMGLCQGRSCEPLVRKILSDKTGQELGRLVPATRRPPLRSIKGEDLIVKSRG